ncbi:MAG: diaminopimelate epimerase [Moraxellaceae bacterium]
MELKFSKYQGTGNDFIMIDNLKGQWNELSLFQIQQLCDRKFGIGADGLIKINTTTGYDFEVDYYNADGSQSFCGNGARCAVVFAHQLGITKQTVSFEAIDGLHSATKTADLVALQMSNVLDWTIEEEGALSLNTGSPHYIKWCTHLQEQDMVAYGKSIRYSPMYASEGINVNLVEVLSENQLAIRTYERGVEDETLSCGTGVTAAAIAAAIQQDKLGNLSFSLSTQGGDLSVKFNRISDKKIEDIWLIGPAKHVFEGTIMF